VIDTLHIERGLTSNTGDDVTPQVQMKVAIDISIFTSSDGAFGNTSGSMDLDVAPQVGDTVSFAFPKTNLARVAGFSGMLRVENRVLDAGGGLNVTLALEDIVVASTADAWAVVEYLEKGFGLVTNVY